MITQVIIHDGLDNKVSREAFQSAIIAAKNAREVYNRAMLEPWRYSQNMLSEYRRQKELTSSILLECFKRL